MAGLIIPGRFSDLFFVNKQLNASSSESGGRLPRRRIRRIKTKEASIQRYTGCSLPGRLLLTAENTL